MANRRKSYSFFKVINDSPLCFHPSNAYLTWVREHRLSLEQTLPRSAFIRKLELERQYLVASKNLTSLIKTIFQSIPKQVNTPLQSICNSLQQSLATILLGSANEVFRPNYVASFGNLIESRNNTDSFIEISYPAPNPV